MRTTHGRSLTLFLAVALSTASLAQAESLLLRDARVHVGDGETVLDRASVLIEDGRIRAIGAQADALAGGARAIDATGLHLTPGLFAADTVLGLVEINAVRATRDEREVGDLTPHVEAWRAVNPDSALLGVALAGGVTTAAVVPRGGLVPGTSAIVSLVGWTPEQMTMKAPAALHVAWPSHRVDRSEDADPKPGEQERRRLERMQALDDLFARARVALKAGPQRSRGDLPAAERELELEALEPVLGREVPVVVHAQRRAQVLAALEWAKRQDVRLVIAGGRDAWRVAEELAAASVPVIVEPVRALPLRDHEPHDVAFRNPVVLDRAGVPIAFSVGSSAFSAPHVRNLPDEAAMAMAWGLPRERALRAITLTPAEIYGLEREIGTIERGKRADLVLWSGEPLEVSSSVVAVFVAGEERPFDDRHTRAWQRYRVRPRTADGR